MMSLIKSAVAKVASLPAALRSLVLGTIGIATAATELPLEEALLAKPGQLLDAVRRGRRVPDQLLKPKMIYDDKANQHRRVLWWDLNSFHTERARMAAISRCQFEAQNAKQTNAPAAK